MKEKTKNEFWQKIRQGGELFVSVMKGRLNFSGDVLVLPSPQISEKGIDTKKLAEAAAVFAFSFILSLGRMAFSTYPLALAFVCSATRLSPIASFGAICGSLVIGESGYVLSYILSLLLRLLFSLWVACQQKKGERIKSALSFAFFESLYIRIALSFAPAFLAGTYTLVSGGFYLYDLLGLLFLLVFIPAAIFVFSGLFDSLAHGTYFFSAALVALVFSLVFSFREISFFSISPAIIAAFIITMYTAKNFGTVRAALFGLLAGFAISPAHAPLFAVAGIVSASVMKHSLGLSLAFSSVFATSLGFFTLGFSSFISLVSSLALGAVAFSLLETAGILPKINIFEPKAPVLRAEPVEIKSSRTLKEDLYEMAHSLADISQIFENLSERVRLPSALEFKQICDRACDALCAECANRQKCWEDEYFSSADMITKLSYELSTYGRASMRSIPEGVRLRCNMLGILLDDINKKSALALERAIKEDKCETIAVDYSNFSAIISEALRSNEKDFSLDPALSATIFEAFSARRKDFPIKNVIVWGDRVKHIVLEGVGGAALCRSTGELARMISEITKMRISTPEIEISESGTRISFEPLPMFSVSYAHALRSAKGKECGDSVIMLDGKRGHFYAMINDGMGTGNTAALTSSLCAVFMEKLLSVGICAESAIKILSALLRAKNIECSSTLDLAEIDLILGNVCFLKSGAAPSYVRRAGNLFRLESKTVPLGIMRGVDAEQIKFELEDGDVIIMLSDGVCADEIDCAWLPTLLTENWDDDIDAMADKIVCEAANRTKKHDDISVGIVRVNKA